MRAPAKCGNPIGRRETVDYSRRPSVLSSAAACQTAPWGGQSTQLGSPGPMIRRLLARLLPGRATRKVRVYGPDQHPVRRDRLSHAARTVIRKLQDEGFHAYIVGGA